MKCQVLFCIAASLVLSALLTGCQGKGGTCVGAFANGCDDRRRASASPSPSPGSTVQYSTNIVRGGSLVEASGNQLYSTSSFILTGVRVSGGTAPSTGSSASFQVEGGSRAE